MFDSKFKIIAADIMLLARWSFTFRGESVGRGPSSLYRSSLAARGVRETGEEDVMFCLSLWSTLWVLKPNQSYE